jgi:hypothetical protein
MLFFVTVAKVPGWGTLTPIGQLSFGDCGLPLILFGIFKGFATGLQPFFLGKPLYHIFLGILWD